MGDSQKLNTEWEKVDSDEYISYDSNYVKFKIGQNLRVKNPGWCLLLGRKETILGIGKPKCAWYDLFPQECNSLMRSLYKKNALWAQNI